MNKTLIIISILLFISGAIFAQSSKDTLIYNLPVVNGKLVYTGNGTAKGRDKKTLDSVAKNWLFSYFKENKLSDKKPLVTFLMSDTSTYILYQGLLSYQVRPGMVNISYMAIIDIKINIADNYYSYQIDHIFFRPKSGFLNAAGYQNDPEYLVRVYKQKHLGWTAMNVTRNQIRDYLSKMNAAVRDCIGSLNGVMRN
jgi:hypothetical protein